MAFSTPASDTSLTPDGAALALPRAEVRGSSLWRDAWRRLLRNKLAVLFQWAYSYFTYKRGARIITGLSEEPRPAASRHD